MRGYGWTAYDARVGGSRTIRDAELHIDLVTDFIKSDDGASWAVRVTGSPRSDAPDDLRTTVIFHFAVEKAGSDDERTLSCVPEAGERKTSDGVDVECQGKIPSLDSFKVSVTGDEQSKPVHDTAVRSVEVPEDKIWQAKGLFPYISEMSSISLWANTVLSHAAIFKDQVESSGSDGLAVDDHPGAGNMHFVQMTFQGAFAVTFAYRGSEGSSLDGKLNADPTES